MTITNRVGLGRNLTAAEVDANFSTLVAAKQATLTAVSDVPGLVTALASKQATLTAVGDVPGLVTTLSGKADTLSAIVLGAGPTSITRAAHLNRPISSAQAGATSIVFSATATSGALAGDAFECLNTGAGTMTASGTITAAAGYKLTAVTGETFTCIYNTATDSFYSTTPSAASGGATLGANVFTGYQQVPAGGQSAACICGTGWPTTGLTLNAASQVGLTVQGQQRLLIDSSPSTVALPLAGSTIALKEGSNCKQGLAVLVAGTVTVACTGITATSRIQLTGNVDGGTVGFYRVSARSVGTNFTITSSSNTDTSSVAYQIFEVSP
jgi:hypothetical protein